MTETAAVAAALGAVLVILGRSRPALVAGLAALGGAEVALATELVPGGLSRTLGSAAGLAAVAVALAALAGLAAVLVRFPAVVPALAVAAAPFRLPLEFGAENRFFVGVGESGALGRLLPLYLVVAAGGLALVWRVVRGETPPALPPRLALPAAALVGLTALSLVWAYDPAAGRDRLAFFVLPLTALLAIVARAPFRSWLPRVLAIETVVLASIFAAVGIGEALTKELVFYDPKIAVANTYTSYFRVTSLFNDPSIYGRHLVIAITVLVALLWVGRVRVWVGALLVAFLWTGLFFSYSQSSMVALAAAVVVVSFLVADRRTRRALAVAAVALALVGGAFFATLLRDESAARVTSGRSTLVSNTAAVIRDHPLVGVGVASKPAATRDEAGEARSARRHVSHTTPLTVMAELGLVGTVFYVAFLAGAAWVLALVRRRDEALGLALIGAFVVLVVHSLFYAVFMEDPLTWGVLALAASFLATTAREPEAARARRTRRPASARTRAVPAG